MRMRQMDVDNEHEEMAESEAITNGTGSETAIVTELSTLIEQLSGENMREIAPQLLKRAADVHWDKMCVFCSRFQLYLFYV
jgi:hypothetical protein